MGKFEEVYEIGEKLGAGHYATVYKCIHRANNTAHAVKVIDKKKTTTKQVGDLLGEVSILKELDHKNCLHLDGFFDEGDNVYVVLQLVSGGELFTKICKERHFSERTAAQMTLQILNGVAYLHSKGIIHRDLKPENLLLKNEMADAEIILVDFGFAEKCGESSETLTKCCGTPLYIAPEVLNAGLFKSGPPYGVLADMWSVGVIAYILLCGYPPFRAKTQADQFKRVVEGRVEFVPNKGWSGVSEDAKDFIMSLLQLDPHKRLTAKQALKHKWLQTNVDENLTSVVEGLSNFSAYNVWRRGIFGVEAINRMLYLQRCTRMKIKPNSLIERMLIEAREPVRVIDLSRNYVGPNGLMALLDVVEQNPNVTTLILGENGANNQVVEKLCIVAKSHPALTTINLDKNPISHLAGRMVLHALQMNPRLTKLSLEGTVLQPQMLARIALQLHRNQLKAKAAATIATPTAE